MTDETIERRLDVLTAEVASLRSKVAALETQLGQGAGVFPAVQPLRPLNVAAPSAGLGSDALWSKVGQSSLLPRIATICFVLVVALVLRTLTDNGMIGKPQGTFLGMGYAALLLALGWRELARDSRLAVVFPVCGAVLMYFIVLESHLRFESLSSLSAYAILLLVLLALSLTSRRFESSGLSCLGVLGTSCVAIALDLSAPNFGLLLLFLLITTVEAYLAGRRLSGCRWSRWIVFVLTVLVWTYWTYELSSALREGLDVAPLLSAAWFFPIMLSFVVIFTLMAVRDGVGDQKWNTFDLVIPSLVGLFVYPLVRVVAIAWHGSVHWLGILGVLVAAFYFATAAWLFRQENTGGAGICGFTFAGAIILAMSFSDAVGSIVLAMLVWSVVALGLAMLSGACEIGGIRLASYLLQGLACLAAVLSGHLIAATPVFIQVSWVAAGLALMAGYQYWWCRKHPLACSIGFFARVDPSDRSAILLIVACVVNGFLLLQMVAYQILLPFVADLPNTLTGTQSVLINLGAMGLMFLALSQRNREILGVAILVFAIGAGKVFLFDFFRSSGIPLVMSVFSFGVAAAGCSVTLNRWQQNGKKSVG